MAVQLDKAPNFKQVRAWTGLFSGIADPAVMSVANYAYALAFDARNDVDFLLYWTATTYAAADRLDLQIYMLDGGVGAPTEAWLLIDYISALEAHHVVKLEAGRSNLLLVRFAGGAFDAASTGLSARAALR